MTGPADPVDEETKAWTGVWLVAASGGGSEVYELGTVEEARLAMEKMVDRLATAGWQVVDGGRERQSCELRNAAGKEFKLTIMQMSSLP